MDKIEWKIEYIDEIPSTNAYLYEAITSNHQMHEGMGIWASYQSKGKGQIGNTWVSDPHENLLLSFLLKPSIAVDKQFVLSQLISLAIVDVLTHYDLEQVRIKWPNDIYVGDKKIAGILIQNALKGRIVKDSIIGIGLNVNQSTFPSLPNPTSMILEKGRHFDVAEIMERLLEKINQYYQELFTHPRNQINHLYHFLLYRRNVNAKFKTEDGIIEGKIEKVGLDGKLEIVTEQGRERFAFKDITFII